MCQINLIRPPQNVSPHYIVSCPAGMDINNMKRSSDWDGWGAVFLCRSRQHNENTPCVVVQMHLRMTPFPFLRDPLCWIRNHDRKSAFSERQTAKQTGWDMRRKGLEWRWEEVETREVREDEEEAKQGKGRQGVTVLPQGASSHPSERWVGLFHDCTFVFQIKDTPPPPQKKQKKSHHHTTEPCPRCNKYQLPVVHELRH